MKKTRRFLCLLLTLVLAQSLCAIPAAAADTQTRSDDPVVFVHGLMGWGQRAGINAVLPYWGMTTGSLTSYLNSLGYETYSATVGPISSAWDRACELYAQLTGTTVDYGAAHAAAHDHARYGITYDRPLFAGWGTKRAVNLVGHSFGGATTRLFLEILTNGCPEEVAAAKAAGVAPSPFFLGGKGSWVHSLTAIAAPHNGTTFKAAHSDFTKLAADLATPAANALGHTTLIIDAKYYSHATQHQYNTHSVHSHNLYQIFTYVKNKEAELARADVPHEVSGMLLYAQTDEEIQPDGGYRMSGNQISVKTLELDTPFEDIKVQLDVIVELHFGLFV